MAYSHNENFGKVKKKKLIYDRRVPRTYRCDKCNKIVKHNSDNIFCKECQQEIIDNNTKIMESRYKEHNYVWVGWEHELKGDNAKNKYDN